MENKLTLPFGTQFSPKIVDLRRVIEVIKAFEGESTDIFIEELVKVFFSKNAKGSRKQMAGNCKNSLVAYGILDAGGGVHLSDFGKELSKIADDDILYDTFARHILKNLNGLVLIETIRSLDVSGISVTNESLITALNKQGFQYSKTANNPQVMKLWLTKAGILNRWRIDESKYTKLVGLSDNEFVLFSELSQEQYFFLKTLYNTGYGDYQEAKAIRELSIASFGITFTEKSFSSTIINPLVEKGLIRKKRTTRGRGARTPLIKLTELPKREFAIPYLDQIKSIAGANVARYYKKSLKDIYVDVNSADKHKKGVALEALTIKIMGIIDLNFLETRLKGSKTGGAEVDILFDSTRLMYSRWQVQCKNTNNVSVEHVAKEVGLAHILKSTAIVIMTTGRVTKPAREYANTIMRSLNLCIIFIEGKDIQSIIAKPTSILGILNRESLAAKQVKILG